MSYQIVEASRDEGSVETLCRALGVSVSGYYAWRGRAVSLRQQRDETLLTHIRQIYQAGRVVHASMRLCASVGCCVRANGWHG